MKKAEVQSATGHTRRKFIKALAATQRKHPSALARPAFLLSPLNKRKKTRRKAQETASLDKVKEKKGGALAHQEEERSTRAHAHTHTVKENHA